MNILTRGLKGTLRSPAKTGAIVVMFALSIALLLAMLAARTSVLQQITSVQENAGNTITISPAGVQGFMGGGDPLSTETVATITDTSHISSTVQTLTDQLGEDDTDLESAIELGSFGQRQQRFQDDSAADSSATTEAPSGMPAMGGGGARTQVTGTTDINSVSTTGGDLTLTSGEAFDGSSDAMVAVIGSSLAEKNSLEVGDTFTLFDQTVTVTGIYETGNTFQDGGVIVPLATLQTLTDQEGAVTSVVATVDSAENVESVVAALETSLGDTIDVTSDVERANNSTTSLTSIANLTLTGVIGAAVAGVAIIGLGMILVVRDRRREIGVMKAIGGSDSKIVGQFVIEGLTVTLIGTVIGLVIGALLSGPITQSLVTNSQSSQGATGMRGGMGGPGAIPEAFNNSVSAITANLSPEVFALSIGIVVIIAVIGSAIPAWATSRIRPAEVLRTE